MIGSTMGTLDPKAEYIVKNGKATAVILPLEQYRELLEDLQDLAVIARPRMSRLFHWRKSRHV
jgi:PHD/YefM family antitoxin component YafN of YafNO toxin-antitoxin module